jgi:hypothetical protein
MTAAAPKRHQTGPGDKVEHRAIGSLQINPKNPRHHDESQIHEVVASIKHFGFVNPVVIDDGGNIIAGHARYEASKRVGFTHIPCIVVPDDWDDPKKSLYNLVDNTTALHSQWQPEFLSLAVSDLKLQDYDLGLLEFDADWSKTFNIDTQQLLYAEGVEMLQPKPAMPKVPKTHKVIFVSVPKDRHEDAKSIIAKALNKAKINHNLTNIA